MTSRRSGITLLELLVVIGIIGLLMFLLLPAVQRARESARRITCQNNLRQMGLAIHNHESAYSALPSFYNGSFLKRTAIAIDEFHYHSWQSAILPQLEQDALYTSIDQSVPATDPTNQESMNSHVATFVCPSTSIQTSVVLGIGQLNLALDSLVAVPNAASLKVGTAARSDYEAMGGVSTGPSGTNNLQNIKFGAWGEPRSYRGKITATTGYRKPRLRDITDGLSSTILIGERAGRPDWYRRGKPVDVYPYDDPKRGIDHHQAAWGISTHFLWMLSTHKQSINETNGTGIYSFHSAGANVGLADGSVRFLSETIDQDVLNALQTRSAGDLVKLD